MKQRAIFYHDGCNLCLAMAAVFGSCLDPARFETEVVDLGLRPERTAEAEASGVARLPSLVVGGQVFAINAHSDLRH